ALHEHDLGVLRPVPAPVDRQSGTGASLQPDGADARRSAGVLVAPRAEPRRQLHDGHARRRQRKPTLSLRLRHHGDSRECLSRMMRERSDQGFTLVELMVSLVAGLIVTIAVVGLARAATTTFFEAARIASVESTVRNASERLRQDLARSS